jgi:hypothetical protein
VNRRSLFLSKSTQQAEATLSTSKCSLQAAAFQLQLAESEMAERRDVEVTGKSQFEVAYEMARFILINMEGRQVKSIKRQDLLHLVADCIEALRGIKVKEIIS